MNNYQRIIVGLFICQSVQKNQLFQIENSLDLFQLEEDNQILNVKPTIVTENEEVQNGKEETQNEKDEIENQQEFEDNDEESFIAKMIKQDQKDLEEAKAAKEQIKELEKPQHNFILKKENQINNKKEETSIDWSSSMFLSSDTIIALHKQKWIPSQGIPKQIFSGGPFEPPKQRENNLNNAPKGTQYRFFNYAQMDNSVKIISKKLERVHLFGIYEAYKSLRPQAFRKDLWSLLILWDQGGIFMDAKMQFSSKVDWIDWKNDEQVLCGDFGQNFQTYWDGFMASTKYHPFYLNVVMASVKRIQERYYVNVFGLTGPGIFTSTMEITDMQPVKRYQCQMKLDSYIDRNNKKKKSFAVYLNSKPLNQQRKLQPQAEFNRRALMATQDVGDTQEIWQHMKKCKGCNNYIEIWEAHQVYCEENEGPFGECDQPYEPSIPCDREFEKKGLYNRAGLTLQVQLKLDKDSELIQYGLIDPQYVF